MNRILLIDDDIGLSDLLSQLPKLMMVSKG